MQHPSTTGDGQTPIDAAEALGLIPSWVATRGDLDRAEQAAIAKALVWARRRRRGAAPLLEERFLKRLHAQMFGDVWRWAGTYRATVKNIGVAPADIREELAKLLADGQYWIQHETYVPDELALRFHHRLVWIHPFPNGNGRHAREAADLLIEALGGEHFSWGAGRSGDATAVRAAYIAALRAADAGDIEPLVAFARS
jgi:Fic-DOC domain mobile mystery protein B